MRITRKRHAFEGQVLEVAGGLRRRQVLYLTLVLPDGTRSLVPAAWTDFQPHADQDPHRAAPRGSDEALGSIRDLLQARHVVEALLGRIGPAGSAETETRPPESLRVAAPGPVAAAGAAGATEPSEMRAGEKIPDVSHPVPG